MKKYIATELEMVKYGAAECLTASESYNDEKDFGDIIGDIL